MKPFRPQRWLRNPHLQTLLPRMLPLPELQTDPERFYLRDGDFVDLAWHDPNPQQPLLVVFHGLAGCEYSPYIRNLFSEAAGRGVSVVLMHFRGCSGEPNLKPRSYHSGETGDASELLRMLTKRFPGRVLWGLGFSLGGNMLLKLLGEREEALLLDSAAAVCAPLELAASARKMRRGFSQVYQHYLIGLLKRAYQQKAVAVAMPGGIPRKPLTECRDFFDYDDAVTAPLHGFRNVHDYYLQASSGPWLQHIKCPTLLLQAEDDPMVPHRSLIQYRLSDAIELEVSRYGGHIGFMEYREGRFRQWLAPALFSWFLSR